MSLLFRMVLFLLLILLVLPQAAAREYSMAELFERALEWDPRLEQIDSGVAAAETLLADAGAAFHPSLSTGFRAAWISELPEMEQPAPGGGTSTVTAGVNDSYAANLTARQLIFAGFAVRRGLAAAENHLAERRFQRRMRQDALRFSLLQAAYGYSLAGLSVESLEASLERLELNRRRIESFFAQGFASELDLLEIDATIAEMNLQLRQQQSERNTARITLRHLSGAADLEALALEEAYLELPPAEGVEVGGAALAANAEYRATDFSLRAREIEETMHRGEYFPKISAFGSLNYGRPGANFFADSWQFYYQGGVELSLTLWDGGARGNALKRDRARLKQLAAEREELFMNLLARGRQTGEALRSAREQLTTARGLLENKQRKYDLVKQLWDAGEQSTLDVLGAEQELTEADIRAKRLEIRLLSLYQDYLLLIDRPLWAEKSQSQKEQIDEDR